MMTTLTRPSIPDRWRAWRMRASRRVGQLLCGVTGHERVTSRDGATLCLVCVHCGVVSPGWAGSPPAYQRTYSGDVTRLRLQKTTAAKVVAMPPHRRRRGYGKAARG